MKEEGQERILRVFVNGNEVCRFLQGAKSIEIAGKQADRFVISKAKMADSRSVR